MSPPRCQCHMDVARTTNAGSRAHSCNRITELFINGFLLDAIDFEELKIVFCIFQNNINYI